jgi:hypothetical protein
MFVPYNGYRYLKFRVFWDVAPRSHIEVDRQGDDIALIMETVRTSETPVHFNMTTQRYIPEDSKLHTFHRENLKSHTVSIRLFISNFQRKERGVDLSP